MEIIRKYQEQLFAQAPFLQADNDYHNAIKDAFLKVPRHLFVSRFRNPPGTDWNIVTPENLPSFLPLLYANKALSLQEGPDNEFESTISQPSLVLQMLDLLELKKGNMVFEIGAASGWTAALMGALVGDEGHVYSSEIIPGMAMQAKGNIGKLSISNVSVLQSDGGLGYEEKAPFDRVIFTAGSYDLPACFYDQLKDGGILLMILKNPVGGDLLIQLKKAGDHFEAIKSSDCAFVKMTGKYQRPALEPLLLEQLAEWEYLKSREICRTPFWWGGPSLAPLHWRTSGFRSFLGITAPDTRFLKEVHNAKSAGYFGILDDEKTSLTIARDHLLITYGNENSRFSFMNMLHAWIDLGMPGATHFKLRIYPIEDEIGVSGRHWIVNRTDSRFIWSL